MSKSPLETPTADLTCQDNRKKNYQKQDIGGAGEDWIPKWLSKKIKGKEITLSKINDQKKKKIK